MNKTPKTSSVPRKTSGHLSPAGEGKIVILAIETSCDETAAAVLKMSAKAIETLSSAVKSQIKLHSKFGGVVPEVAARAHVKNILPVVQKALKDSRLKIKDVNYIAVTQGPGLIPSLIVGVEFAKALSLATGIPVIPVNHLAGHLYSPFGSLQPTPYNLQPNLFPNISLIVSGGHTLLVLMKDLKNYKVLGQTVDDAAGEAFDKVAKLLRLPYPGGPEVSKLAAKAQSAVEFPRPMIHDKTYNFSFAGLKTAVLYYVQSMRPKNLALSTKQTICAGFQNAVVDVLVTKALRAAKEFKAKSVSVSGGVSANTALRQALAAGCKTAGVAFLAADKKLATDNAEMIGLAAAMSVRVRKKSVSLSNIQADPNLSL